MSSKLTGTKYTWPAIETPKFSLPERTTVKCDGCGCNFAEDSGHVSFSFECEEIRVERLISQGDAR